MSDKNDAVKLEDIINISLEDEEEGITPIFKKALAKTTETKVVVSGSFSGKIRQIRQKNKD